RRRLLWAGVAAGLTLVGAAVGVVLTRGGGTTPTVDGSAAAAEVIEPSKEAASPALPPAALPAPEPSSEAKAEPEAGAPEPEPSATSTPAEPAQPPAQERRTNTQPAT